MYGTEEDTARRFRTAPGQLIAHVCAPQQRALLHLLGRQRPLKQSLHQMHTALFVSLRPAVSVPPMQNVLSKALPPMAEKNPEELSHHCASHLSRLSGGQSWGHLRHLTKTVVTKDIGYMTRSRCTHARAPALGERRPGGQPRNGKQGATAVGMARPRTWSAGRGAGATPCVRVPPWSLAAPAADCCGGTPGQ